MKYKVVETDNNPFGDYFEISNPSYHQTIQKHYVNSDELEQDVMVFADATRSVTYCYTALANFH
jgi:hypothetical protein